MSVIFPWQGKERRREAIAGARAEKERSRLGATRAAVIERDIARMAERNHFAQIIADQIMRQHQGGG